MAILLVVAVIMAFLCSPRFRTWISSFARGRVADNNNSIDNNHLEVQMTNRNNRLQQPTPVLAPSVEHALADQMAAPSSSSAGESGRGRGRGGRGKKQGKEGGVNNRGYAVLASYASSAVSSTSNSPSRSSSSSTVSNMERQQPRQPQQQQQQQQQQQRRPHGLNQQHKSPIEEPSTAFLMELTGDLMESPEMKRKQKEGWKRGGTGSRRGGGGGGGQG